jgi:hypothetical protein
MRIPGEAPKVMATKSKKPAKSSPKSAAKGSAKAASKKANDKKPAKSSAKPAKAAKPEKKVAAPAAKVKTLPSALKKEVSKKAKPQSEVEKRRSRAAAAVAAAMEEDEDSKPDDDDDEFDPEAFLAASGGKGLVQSHVMRKERVDLNVPVRYRVSGPLVQNAILINLSKTGLGLEAKEVLKKGTVLRIEIPLPHTSELFAVQAEVIWSDYVPGSVGKARPTHIGLIFLSMSLAKKAVISTFIQQRRDEIVMAKIGLDRFTESVPVAGLD